MELLGDFELAELEGLDEQVKGKFKHGVFEGAGTADAARGTPPVWRHGRRSGRYYYFFFEFSPPVVSKDPHATMDLWGVSKD